MMTNRAWAHDISGDQPFRTGRQAGEIRPPHFAATFTGLEDSPSFFPGLSALPASPG